MKRLLYFIFMLLPYLEISAQSYVNADKPVIDFDAIQKWSSVDLDQVGISNDGKYIHYWINNKPVGSRTLVLQSTDNKWKKELAGVEIDWSDNFTVDSKYFLYRLTNDSLAVVKLGTDHILILNHIKSYKILNSSKYSILFESSDPLQDKVVHLFNFDTQKDRTFDNIQRYQTGNAANFILFNQANVNPSDSAISVYLLDLKTDNSIKIWDGEDASNFVFELGSVKNRFCFIGYDNQKTKSIWMYEFPSLAAKLILKEREMGLNNGVAISSIIGFGPTGKNIYLDLRSTIRSLPAKSDPNGIKITIWSYTDEKIQSEQLADLDRQKITSQRASIVFGDRPKVIMIGSDTTIIERKNSEWNMIYPDRKGVIGESAWNATAMVRLERFGNSNSKELLYLVSALDGSKYHPNEHTDSSIEFFELSPNGKYISYYDERRGDYFSCEISSGKIHNLTDLSSIEKITEVDGVFRPCIRTIGWFDGDVKLVTDGYDLWKIDLQSRAKPICVTNKYGRNNNIIFSVISQISGYKCFKDDDRLLLAAFNKQTKENGFFEKTISKAGDPLLLTMSSDLYYNPDGYTSDNKGFLPLKARNAPIYLVLKQNTSNSPNFYITGDFKNFKQVSSLDPEIGYNWVKSELITYKVKSSATNQGILYKPQNFDESKKYPLIINYYEKKSQELNFYHRPGWSSPEIDIPYFVSRGYLVFTPDIYYIIGKPGKTALDCVLSGYEELIKLPYIDSFKVGLQGHSWGGFETTYIITHTDKFRAAFESAGLTNAISANGSIADETPPGQLGAGAPGYTKAESGQRRLGATIWERPDIYVDNSPVLFADRVTTPLLMVHNRLDGAVPYEQGIEFFLALRRLGKRAWMLEYDGEAHYIRRSNTENSIDHTIRMTQFFDHYLKGLPAPLWMLEGVPASRKGIDSGLSLDTLGRTPVTGGLLKDAEKEKIKIYSTIPLLDKLCPHKNVN